MLRCAAVQPRVRKRPRPAEEREPAVRGRGEVRFQEVVLYLVERKMGSSRRDFLSGLARSKGFRVDDVLSDEVTHVVAEGNRAPGLWAWLRGRGLCDVSGMQVLDIAWFTDSMRAMRPVAVETRHRIQDAPAPSTDVSPPAETAVSQYACQRRTPTENHNKIFTDAFEVLAQSLDFAGREGQALAFRRAASLLKSLPQAVGCLGATQGLPCLGEHSRAIIEEILTFGRCFKVEEIQRDERYQTLTLFTGVFGVGPKTAEKWYRAGMRLFQEVLAQPSIQLNRMQIAGFLYHGDISRPVSRSEARAVGNIIEDIAHRIHPDATLALTGGFRRGKEYGHDVDFLLTTPTAGKEEGLLVNLIETLRQQGLLLYSEYQASTFDVSRLPCLRFEAMDRFPKCFLILRLEEGRVQGEGLQRAPGDRRGWRAVRVDVVAPPVDRYAYALLGWSGSTLFERDLRRFARLERHMLLDNHALYDKTKREFLPAKTEEDIFVHLGLEYVEPWLRNA